MTTLKQQQKAFDELTAIYDSLEDIVAILEDTSTRNVGNQLPIAKHFIDNVGDAVDAMTQTYCQIMKRGGVATSQEVRIIEAAAVKVIEQMEAVLQACQKPQLH